MGCMSNDVICGNIVGIVFLFINCMMVVNVAYTIK